MLEILNMQITAFHLDHRGKIMLLTALVFAALC